MKTLILFNTVNRPDTMAKCIHRALTNCGMKDLIVRCRNNGGEQWGEKNEKKIDELKVKFPNIDWHYTSGENIGNSNSLNQMLYEAKGIEFDYIAILGDDIEMPENWLKKAIEKNKELIEKGFAPGLCGFHPFREKVGKFNDKLGVYFTRRVFGCWVLRKDIFIRHGYFLAFSNYGYWDTEYNDRVSSGGHDNFCLKDFYADHKGSDVGKKTDYRKMKDKHLSQAYRRINKLRHAVGKTDYVPYDRTKWDQVKHLI